MQAVWIEAQVLSEPKPDLRKYSVYWYCSGTLGPTVHPMYETEGFPPDYDLDRRWWDKLLKEPREEERSE